MTAQSDREAIAMRGRKSATRVHRHKFVTVPRVRRVCTECGAVQVMVSGRWVKA